MSDRALVAAAADFEFAREVGVSKHTIYAWKAKYGGMDVSQAQEAKQFAGREHADEKAGGGSESGQGSTAGGDPKTCRVRRRFASDWLRVRSP
jgi:uncharacterized protein YjcR